MKSTVTILYCVKCNNKKNVYNVSYVTFLLFQVIINNKKLNFKQHSCNYRYLNTFVTLWGCFSPFLSPVLHFYIHVNIIKTQLFAFYLHFILIYVFSYFLPIFSARMYFPLCCVSAFLKSFIFFMEFCVKKQLLTAVISTHRLTW